MEYKISREKSSEARKSLILVVAKHAFLSILIFILIDAILGGILFYHYAIKPADASPNTGESPVRFKKSLYNEVASYISRNKDYFKNNPEAATESVD